VKTVGGFTISTSMKFLSDQESLLKSYVMQVVE